MGLDETDRPGAAVHEGSSGGVESLTSVLAEAVRALDKDAIDYLLIGGQASSLLGRPRCSSDIDLLVTPEDAPTALAALDRAGFRTERVNPHWLFKAYRRDVLVDLLFKVRGEIYLDSEMLRRSTLRRATLRTKAYAIATSTKAASNSRPPTPGLPLASVTTPTTASTAER